MTQIIQLIEISAKILPLLVKEFGGDYGIYLLPFGESRAIYGFILPNCLWIQRAIKISH
jgi:hypothetical protein